MVEQDSVSVTHYAKNKNGVWENAGVYENRADHFALAFGDAQITVSVGKIYQSVSFDERT